ncbi:MAG: hypothetical protein RJA07_2226 [Bacteroidota bacterium]
MPKHLEIEQSTFKIVLWYITEPLSFFENIMTNWGDDYVKIKAENRKLQYAASRYATSLLTFNNDASQIKKGEFNRPFLQNPNEHISISHDGNWAAVAIGKQQVGVDVFCMQARVLRIADKFINADEKIILEQNIQSEPDKILYYSLLWSIKEAVFKWMQLQNIEFKTDIVLTELKPNRALIQTKIATDVEVNFRIENEFCLCWIAQ